MNINDFYKTKLESNTELRKIVEDKDRQFFSDVAHLITEARLHAGLTQEKLAVKLETKQSSIARLERGTGLPSLSFLLKVAKALGTHLIAPRFGFMKDFRAPLNVRKSFVVYVHHYDKPPQRTSLSANNSSSAHNNYQFN